LPKALSRLFGSEPGPLPLPQNLLPDLVRQQPLLLCLDYDGTLSEIAREPSLARPVAGVVEALHALAEYRPRIVIALVSGRTLDSLRSLLPAPRGIAFAGVHGLEMLDANGRYELARGTQECSEDLARVRTWLEENVPRGAGFVVEDKSIGVALHYRQVARPIAYYVRDSLEQFIKDRTSSLEPRHGKMVIEAIPRIATKATAVRTLWQRVGPDFVPAYFGDDLSDEDAFTALSEHGFTVLVGPARKTAARYRLDGPADVVSALESIAAALAESPGEGDSG
jgi:trehalose-phosphatase